MYFKQIVKEDLGCASYIPGCSNANVCAVVDPGIDMVDDILEIAASREMKNEWDEGHIRHSIHIPYYCIEQRMQEIDLAKPLVVLCASGQRSAIACAILQKHDIPGIFNLIGGIQAWKRAGLSVVRQR